MICAQVVAFEGLITLILVTFMHATLNRPLNKGYFFINYGKKFCNGPQILLHLVVTELKSLINGIVCMQMQYSVGAWIGALTEFVLNSGCPLKRVPLYTILLYCGPTV